MASSLSNLVDNLSEGIHKIKCKYGHNDKKCETCGITYEICSCFFEYTNLTEDLEYCTQLIDIQKLITNT